MKEFSQMSYTILVILFFYLVIKHLLGGLAF